MYTQALEFLEDERDAWRPYEALGALSDEQLERATDPAGSGHGWSGRDLIAHLVGWHEIGVQVAKELAVGERSAALAELGRDWDEKGDAFNDELHARWRALPMAEVRRRLTEVPGELRGYLTVVPETRWVKHHEHMRFFLEDTLEHYEEHEGELEAVLAGARS